MSAFQELSKIRHDFMRKIRSFFEERDFLEVQTPALVINPGLEPHLEYFSTQWVPSMQQGQKERFFLPTSPEYHLKKALGQGLPRVYEIAKSFRNGEISKRHEPEFLMLEWYRNPGNYREIAQDAFELISSLAEEFSPHPERWRLRDITVSEAFRHFAGVDLEALRSKETFEDDFHLILLEKIERKLGQDSIEFLWDYPMEMAALAKRKKENPQYCERFEIYWNGFELANAFGELTDPNEQKLRFLEDQKKRQQLYPNEIPPAIDEEMLDALGKIFRLPALELL
jgi:elongation factor P--(R)-beta-lysine ligase